MATGAMEGDPSERSSRAAGDAPLTASSAEGLILARLRRLLRALLALGLAGTLADLLLLGHVEDRAQWIPVLACGLSLAALIWHARSGRGASTRIFRAAMSALVLIGVVGVVLHFRGNMEFQLELDSDLSGFELFAKVMQAKAPPALAPFNLALLGLVGLSAAYRMRPDATSAPTDDRSVT